MKKIIVFLSVIISFHASAQKTGEVEIIKRQIDSLQQRLDERNYTRVPKEDYEKNLKLSVENAVSGSITKWIGFLALLIGLTGVFIANFFKNQTREQVSSNLKTIDETISKFKESEKEINAQQDENIKGINEDMKKLIAAQEKFITDSEATINKKINQTLSFMWDDIADSKIRVADSKNHNGKDLISEISALLENKTIEMRKEKRENLIDTLMRCYYYTQIDNRDKEMIKLLRKYDTHDELTLRPTTYANAAIALSSNYENYGNKDDRNTCIECCDKAVSRLPDYGLPFAIKMEVFMIDYKKAYDENDKQAALENTRRVINNIKNNQSVNLCCEIIERLNLDRKVLHTYIDNLEYMFRDDLLEIRERACSDIAVSKGLAQTRFNNIFHAVLKECMMRTPDTNGQWVASQIIQDGSEIKEGLLFSNLILNNYDYEFVSQREKGVVHFLPYSKTARINFYVNDNNGNYIKQHKAIFKIEGKDQLTFCFSNSIDIAPLDFTSTKENQNTLVTYNKVQSTEV